MKFIARKHRNLRLVLDPQMRFRDQGRAITKSLTGETKLGLSVQFENSIYETEDKTIIKFLKNHPSFGIAFIAENEVGTPSVDAVRAENEKKAKAEELRSKCPECGEQYDNEMMLNSHMKTHGK